MRVKIFKFLNLKPVKDEIAYEWMQVNEYGFVLLPDIHYYHRDLNPGIFCVGKVIAVGPEVRLIKPGNFILFGEYGADSGMYLEHDKIYFTHEWEIIMMFDEMPQLLTSKEKAD